MTDLLPVRGLLMLKAPAGSPQKWASQRLSHPLTKNHHTPKPLLSSPAPLLTFGESLSPNPVLNPRLKVLGWLVLQCNECMPVRRCRGEWGGLKNDPDSSGHPWARRGYRLADSLLADISLPRGLPFLHRWRLVDLVQAFNLAGLGLSDWHRGEMSISTKSHGAPRLVINSLFGLSISIDCFSLPSSCTTLHSHHSKSAKMLSE